MLFFVLSQLKSKLRARNSFLWVHLFLVLMFGLLYWRMSSSGGWGLESREVSELSSFHSSLYYSLITEFTVGALNSPSSYWLRSCVMLQILISFIFLNL